MHTHTTAYTRLAAPPVSPTLAASKERRYREKADTGDLRVFNVKDRRQEDRVLAFAHLDV